MCREGRLMFKEESRNSASWQVGVWHEESGEPWWPSQYTGPGVTKRMCSACWPSAHKGRDHRVFEALVLQCLAKYLERG